MSLGSALSACDINKATEAVVTSYSRHNFKMHTGQTEQNLMSQNEISLHLKFGNYFIYTHSVSLSKEKNKQTNK